MMLGKLQRAHSILRGHFAPAYLVGSNMLRANLFFIYASISQSGYLSVRYFISTIYIEKAYGKFSFFLYDDYNILLSLHRFISTSFIIQFFYLIHDNAHPAHRVELFNMGAVMAAISL